MQSQRGGDVAFAIHRDVLPRNKGLFEMMHQSARGGVHDQWSICSETEPAGNQGRANEMGWCWVKEKDRGELTNLSGRRVVDE